MLIQKVFILKRDDNECDVLHGRNYTFILHV